MKQMKKSWKVYVETENRKKSPQHKRNWQNFFGFVLRDVGKVAIMTEIQKSLSA